MKHLLKAFIMLTIAISFIATGCGGGGGGGGTGSPIPTPPAETGSISGQIVNNTIAIGGGSLRAQGGGTEEIKVYVEQNPSLTTLADETGKFLLENVPAGVVNLIAEHKTPDGQLFRMKSDEITVKAAETFTMPAPIAVLKADKEVNGRVINAINSASIEGVTITAWGKTATSDGSGGFVLKELPNLAFQLKFSKTGFETKVVAVETGSELAQTFLVELTPAAATLPGVTTGTIKGKVVSTMNHFQFPAAGAKVFSEQNMDITTTTDDEGNFTISNIPAGKVYITAVSSDEISRARTEELELSAGQTLDLTGSPIILALAMRSVGGFVKITGGTEADAVGVKVTVLEKTTLTDANRMFRILNLPMQKVVVRFEKSGFVSKEIEVDLAAGDFNEDVEMAPLKLEEVIPEIVDEVPLRDINTIAKGMYKMQLDANNILLTVEGIVRLPEITGLRRSDLYMFSNDGGAGSFETQVDKDGFITTRAVSASSSPSLIMLGIKDKYYLYTYHPMLLKVWHPNDTGYNNYIDARSTAEALVLFDKILWTLDKDKFLLALNKVRTHSALNDLIGAVELALRAPEPESLYSDTLMQKSYTIARSVAESLNAVPDLSPSIRPSLRAATGDVDKDKFAYVEDDGARNSPAIMLTNRSYCHYSVEVKNGMTNLVVKSPAGNNYFTLERSTHTSYSWSWPPDRKTQVEANVGPGEFITTFTKQKGLSVFDGLMTLAGTVIGAGASSYEELSDGYKMLSTTGGGLMEIINTATTASINSSADALALADKLLFSTGKMGFEVLMDFAPKYFGVKLARELKNSWFKTAAKFFMKKALIWGVAAYNTTDVALIIYDVATTPDSYTEKGWQTKAGWYGDLFAEKIGKMKNMRVLFNLPMKGTAYFKEIADDGTITETSFETDTNDVRYDSPSIAVDGSMVSFTADPAERLLIGATYKNDSSRGYVEIEFSNVGFNGFIDRSNGNVFDETKMQFVWGNPGSDMIQISKISHKDIYPPLNDYSFFEYWAHSSTEWASVQVNTGHVAGVILSE